MPDKEIKETKETHFTEKTKEIEKGKASILVEKLDVKSMTNYKKSTIQVKDDTSQKAFETFKKVRKEIE